MVPELRKNLRFNWIANLVDGGFFGFALGFASFVTILPLFVSTMTDSAILIGLIPAIHSVGWQLPQLMMANHVSRQKRYKPLVLLATVQERLPYLGLVLVAWFLPALGNQAALVLTFGLLIWQGLGAGFTATAWQSMIGKIIPSEQRTTFFGSQSAVANLLSSLGAVLAGLILERTGNHHGFVISFILACVGMLLSWLALAQTREPEHIPQEFSSTRSGYWKSLGAILRRDRNFRGYLAARILSQLAIMGFAFYTVYVVRQHGMSVVEVGVMTGVYLGAQIAANPVMGWMADRWSRRSLMEVGVLAAVFSGGLAWWAPSAGWFYLVFILAGIANVAIWTIGLSMILGFGSEAERPAYIGLSNTLVAPASILAPFLGGWLADRAGYPSTFLASALIGLLTVAVLQFWVHDPELAGQVGTAAGMAVEGIAEDG